MSNNLVGIVGLPDVRDALQELGVEVVSGDTFPEASRHIREAAKSPTLPVLIEDHKQLGLPQLISRIEQNSTIVIVRRDAPVLEDHWVSVPIASSLGDYLRAAGVEPSDTLLDDIFVDADGKITEDAPVRTDEGSTAAQEEQPPLEAPTHATSLGDWLEDDDLALGAPADSPALPHSAHESSASPSADTLHDWLSDEEKDEPGPSSDLTQERSDLDEDDDEEDFEGFFAPTRPAPTPETQHPAAAEGPVVPVSATAKTGRRRAETNQPAAAPAQRSRRRIPMPQFTEAEAEAATAPDTGPSLLDDELFSDRPAEAPGGEVEDEDSYDVDDIMEDTLAPRTSRSAHRLNTPLGHVIVSYAGKGGVGKSTVSLCLAQAAAEIGGLTVCLIDGNRGQGDLGLYLKVRKSDLPSIYDAVTIGDPSTAFLSPEQIAAARSGTGDRISFSFVQAPRPMHDGELSQQIAAVRPEHYAEVIRLARQQFDLVIIDTQITEGLDTSGVIDNVIGPVLRSGGYGLGIAEFTTVGVENLLIAAAYLRSLGADSARMMSTANKVSPSVGDYGKLPQLLGRESRWKGAIHLDDRIEDDMKSRHVPYAVPTMRAVVLDVLHAVTGLTEFSPKEAPASKRSKLPFWKRWFSR